MCSVCFLCCQLGKEAKVQVWWECQFPLGYPVRKAPWRPLWETQLPAPCLGYRRNLPQLRALLLTLSPGPSLSLQRPPPAQEAPGFQSQPPEEPAVESPSPLLRLLVFKMGITTAVGTERGHVYKGCDGC